MGRGPHDELLGDEMRRWGFLLLKAQEQDMQKPAYGDLIRVLAFEDKNSPDLQPPFLAVVISDDCIRTFDSTRLRFSFDEELWEPISEVSID